MPFFCFSRFLPTLVHLALCHRSVIYRNDSHGILCPLVSASYLNVNQAGDLNDKRYLFSQFPPWRITTGWLGVSTKGPFSSQAVASPFQIPVTSHSLGPWWPLHPTASPGPCGFLGPTHFRMYLLLKKKVGIIRLHHFFYWGPDLQKYKFNESII